MRGRMKHLILPVLTALFCVVCLSARAGQEVPTCQVTSGPVTLSNINLKPDTPLNTEVSGNTHLINYTCRVTSVGQTSFRPALAPNLTGNFKDLIDLLDGAGLAMKITITERDGGAQNIIPWTTLKSGNWSWTFGQIMTSDHPSPGGQGPDENYFYTYTRSADIKLSVYVAEHYKQNSTVYTVKPQTNILYIYPDRNYPSTSAVKGVNTAAFNIRILSSDLGSIDIMPKTVHLGHFTKISDATLSRSGDFTVTAQQILKPAPGQTFSLPLNISFKRGDLSFTGDRQHLALKNWGDPEDNGLQLAVRNKRTSQLVTFSENLPSPDASSPLGVLSVSGAGAQGVSNISERYTIEVNRRSGAEVKTGEIHGSLAVEVTYN